MTRSHSLSIALILLFIFVTPLWVNFRDKPRERPPQQTEIVVQQTADGFMYKVDASSVEPGSDREIRRSLLRIIEPVTGFVMIDKYEEVRDRNNRVVAYKVWTHR